MTAVDLRSDTVTRPTPAMRRAMAEAEVGDDVFGDDPTVKRLEETVAGILGKEAALYVPSGTMANQISMALTAGPGTEVLVEEGSHVLNFEGGAASALWGITLRPVAGRRGVFTPADVAAAVRPENEHFAPLRAVAFENTHNRAGGAVWPPEALHAAAGAAREAKLLVHLDGARLWNAAAATGTEPADLARSADTVSVCFSKGLGSPVGSAVASTAERIHRARFLRKRLGGGMRQAGIIAAGALHALHHHRDRLAEDHARAAQIGAALAELPGVEVLPVETNIVIAELRRTGRAQAEVVSALATEGVLATGFGTTRIRLVTHLDVNDEGIERGIIALRRVLGGAKEGRA
jgi:threonine aldolase